jgi:hypothetical protein
MANGDDISYQGMTGEQLAQMRAEYEAIKEEAEARAAAVARETELQRQIVEDQRKQIPIAEKLKELAQIRKDIEGLNLKIAERNQIVAQNTYDFLNQANESLKDQVDYKQMIYEAEVASLNAQEAILNIELERLKKDMERVDLATDEGIQLQKNIDSKIKELEVSQTLGIVAKENVDSTRLQGNAMKNMVGAISEQMDLKGQLYNMDSVRGFNAIKQFAELDAAQKKSIREQLTARLKLNAPALGLAALETASRKILNASLNLTEALDNQRAAIMKNTGASRQMASEFTNTMDDLASFGVTAESAAQSFTALFDNFSEFTRLSKADRATMMDTVSVLELHGVAGADAAKGLELATKAFGMTGQEAAKQQLRIAAFAKDLGRAPGEIAREFASAAPSLAKFGRDAEEVFKKLQGTIKATGLEMNTILGVAESFDTFETATDQVGRLNAMLGGDFLGVMDMMETEDPAERFKMIADAVNNAGFAFDQMTYYEKIAIKEAMGLQSVDELAKALSGDFESLGIATGKTSASMEAMAARGQANLSIQEQFKALMTALTPTLLTVADAISGVLGGLATFIGKYGTVLESIAGGVAIIGGLVTALGTLAAGYGMVAAAAFLANMSMLPMLAVILAVTAAFSTLYFILFKKRSSPTFFEGLGLIGQRFDGVDQSVNVTKTGVKDLTAEVPRLNNAIQASAAPTQAIISPEARQGAAAPGMAAAGGGTTNVTTTAGNTEVNVYIGEQRLNEMIQKVVHKQLNPVG